jgi:predicted membrane-bound mannosyltransferase
MSVCDVHFHQKSRFERLRPAMVTLGALAVIGGIAAVTRFWELGLRTYQGDETVYSLLANQAAQGRGWEQSPVVHGPMQFFAAAAAFRLLGVTDVAARAMPAVFGVLLAMLPLLFARQIGRAGSIVAATLLAVSPVMLYYSRFAGPDIYLAFFSLATAILIWRYLERPERAYLYLMAITLAFAVVTSEMALLVIAIFAAYLWHRTGVDLIQQRRAGAQPERAVTHYERLGLNADATLREIRAAHKAALDRHGKNFDRKAVVTAYQVLSTASRREAYDRTLAQRAARAAVVTDQSVAAAEAGAIGLGAGFIAALWPFIAGMRRRRGLSRLPDAASPLLVMMLLVLPFYGPLVEKLPFVGDRGFAGQTTVYVIGGVTHKPGGELPVMLITLGVLFAAAMIAGIAWKWHAWVICWALFYGIVVTMFSGFFTDQGSIWTGIWGTLDYWWRPEAHQPDGPYHYYAMILPVYELVPIAIAALGAALLAMRGGWRNRIVLALAVAAIAAIIVTPGWMSPISHHRPWLACIVAAAAVLSLRLSDTTKFLAFWAVAAFFAFSAIGRKEPWLAVQIALPLALLAARLVNDALASFEMPAIEMPTLRMVAPRRLAQAAIVATFVAGAGFSARTAILASWGHGHVPQLADALVATDHGDTPIELIQPDRIAPDVREVRAAIDRAGQASGQGANIPVAVDTSYDFAKGWLWYLRAYPNLTIEDMRKGYQVPPGTIALFDARNRAKVRVDETAVSLAFTSSWSFPGDYNRLTTGDVAGDLSSASWWSSWSRYLIDRTRAGQPDAVQGVAYFPQALSAALPASRQSNVLASAVAPQPAAPPAPTPAP